MQAQLSKGLLNPNQMIKYVSCCTLLQLLEASSRLMESADLAKMHKYKELKSGMVSENMSRPSVDAHAHVHIKICLRLQRWHEFGLLIVAAIHYTIHQLESP